MAAWIAELPVRIHYGREVTGFAQDDAGVDVELSGGQSLRAQYLVGCDGGRSLIRKHAGIEFPGWDPTVSNLIAEAEMTEEPELGVRRDDTGVHGIGRLEYEIRDGEIIYKDDGPVRIMVTEQQIGPSSEPTLRDLSEALIAVYGTDFGVHSPTSISRFTDMTRQAAAYRAGRVLLAGDSAHVHYPAGGQGLSLGVQDAVNLGWKLAQVVNGTSPESLLDTYQDERHPVAARALRHTMAQTALHAPGRAHARPWPRSCRSSRRMDEPRKRIAGLISGLDIHYDLGEGHPLLGRRMPDLDLVTADGPLRVFELLHGARPALLNLGEPGGFDIAPWADRVQLIDADCARPVGASGARRGRRSRRRADPPRRLRRLGRSAGRPWPAGRAHAVVRSTGRGLARGRGPRGPSAPRPLAAQQREHDQRHPLALEPVGLDESRFAPEAEPLEQALNRGVAVVGLAVDPVDVVLVEQPPDHRSERLGRQPAALARGRERHADLRGLRLAGRDAHGAVAVERPADPIDDGDLHPVPWIAERRTLLRCDEALGLGRRVRRLPRLVARDVGLAAVGGERRGVAGPERPQQEALGEDLERRTVRLPHDPASLTRSRIRRSVSRSSAPSALERRRRRGEDRVGAAGQVLALARRLDELGPPVGGMRAPAREPQGLEVVDDARWRSAGRCRAPPRTRPSTSAGARAGAAPGRGRS